MWSPSYPILAASSLFFLFGCMAPPTLSLLSSSSIFLFEWTITSIASPISLPLIIDPFSLILSSTVLFISANVILFANSYIKGDPYLNRFIILVILFVASINFLIFIPNLITLLLGWDGLGLTSFLLVIYYQNPKSLGAGIITALTNRIGDVLILISIRIALNLSSWNFILTPSTIIPSLSILIIIAATTKRAQIPFSSWLPAAIAAPTPVSALVHSSTLVTAGVFLLFRFYPTLSSFYIFKPALLIIATLTTLMAGISANTECDIKKIIALSTLSQLGVIIVSLGLGYPLLALFHLITHALFKALLFLCAGTLIHLHGHSQDLRFMGRLPSQLPSISSAMMVSNIALCGSPFLAGFYSKDAILESCLCDPYRVLIIFLFFFATGLTVSYTMRFLIAVVWGPVNVSPFHIINDNDLFCSTPTWILGLSSIIGGASLNWIYLSPFVEPVLPLTLKLLTLLVCSLGLIFGWTLSSPQSARPSSALKLSRLNYAICYIWFLTPIASQHSLPAPNTASIRVHKTLDQGWEEVLGGSGAHFLSTFLRNSSIAPNARTTTAHLSLSLIFIPIALALL